MRPRNLLKIFNHARGFAVNFGHRRIEVEDFEKGLKAYSQDLVVELDRELADVSGAARDLLYHLIDLGEIISTTALWQLLQDAGVTSGETEAVVDYLLYYGVLGIRVKDIEYYVFDTNYDLKPLKIRSKRAGAEVNFVVNPAFWPALNIRPASGGDEVQELEEQLDII